jgi:hypothetical protein
MEAWEPGEDLPPHEAVVVRSAAYLLQLDFQFMTHPQPPNFFEWELVYTALDGTTVWKQPEGGGIVNVRMMEPDDWMWN